VETWRWARSSRRGSCSRSSSVSSPYVAGAALPAGADYLAVFRFAGTTAFIAYTMGFYPQSIWYKRPWSLQLKNTVDGLIYALLAAGVFGWLWP